MLLLLLLAAACVAAAQNWTFGGVDESNVLYGIDWLEHAAPDPPNVRAFYIDCVIALLCVMWAWCCRPGIRGTWYACCAYRPLSCPLNVLSHTNCVTWRRAL